VYGSLREGRMEIAEKVKEIVSEQLDVGIDDVKPEARFIEDLGADSLAIVELVLAFEEQFEIDIPDEDTEKIATVGDAVKYIQDHVK
jgi:acyl carrier protein